MHNSKQKSDQEACDSYTNSKAGAAEHTRTMLELGDMLEGGGGMPSSKEGTHGIETGQVAGNLK